ncbi:hypothetical protein [Azospirillum sp. TSO35-2]|uniref:hypothetical protein n=1 Tax=Azospirillum sp. TSO35-2 TaxID=716796 RepID=UPI000D60B493|nr:hypothetical protein [Azospirillum sp. TSO35-2]PWC40616.1 hypothetical protein TSO352_00715 [Azospirillum sp. TSO35-2]
MTKSDFSAEIFASSALHLDVVDEFIAITQAKLAATTSDFARDSLNDLLAGLTEQRETYRAVLAATAHPLSTPALAA